MKPLLFGSGCRNVFHSALRDDEWYQEIFWQKIQYFLTYGNELTPQEKYQPSTHLFNEGERWDNPSASFLPNRGGKEGEPTLGLRASWLNLSDLNYPK